MKKVESAFIFQVLSFDSDEERKTYLERLMQKAEARKQPKPVVIWEYVDENSRFCARIAKPYNNSPMDLTNM